MTRVTITLGRGLGVGGSGEGDEALLLADWPTLHLDVLARQQDWRGSAYPYTTCRCA